MLGTKHFLVGINLPGLPPFIGATGGFLGLCFFFLFFEKSSPLWCISKGSFLLSLLPLSGMHFNSFNLLVVDF